MYEPHLTYMYAFRCINTKGKVLIAYFKSRLGGKSVQEGNKRILSEK